MAADPSWLLAMPMRAQQKLKAGDLVGVLEDSALRNTVTYGMLKRDAELSARGIARLPYVLGHTFLGVAEIRAAAARNGGGGASVPVLNPVVHLQRAQPGIRDR